MGERIRLWRAPNAGWPEWRQILDPEEEWGVSISPGAEDSYWIRIEREDPDTVRPLHEGDLPGEPGNDLAADMTTRSEEASHEREASDPQ